MASVRVLRLLLCAMTAAAIGTAGAGPAAAADGTGAPTAKDVTRTGVAPSSGQAASTKVTSAKTPAAVPNASDPGAFSFYGGLVMSQGVTVHTIYWDPDGLFASEAPNYANGVDGFLRDVAADSGSNQSIFSVPTEYYDSLGRNIRDKWQFGGRITDTDPYPTFGGTCAVTAGVPCVTDAQIQGEVQHVISRDHSPVGSRQLYAVLLPPGVDQCYELANNFSYVDEGVTYEYNDCAAGGDTDPIGYYCSYHSNIEHTAPQGPPAASQAIMYAVLPWEDPHGLCETPHAPTNTGDEATIDSLAHEIIEAQTDPLVDENEPGWYSPDLDELADACETSYGAVLGRTAIGRYNQLINHHPYLLQQIWSNRADGCVTRSADVPAGPAKRGASVAAVTSARPGMMMTHSFDALPVSIRDDIAKTFRSASATGSPRVTSSSLGGLSSSADLARPGVAENDTSPRIGLFASPEARSAIGPSTFIEATNTAFAMYDRTLHQIALTATDEVAGVPIELDSPASAPDVTWDPQSDRFEYVMAMPTGDTNPADAAQRAADPDLLLYGFSRTDHPTGFGSDQWCQYSASTDQLAANGVDALEPLLPELGHFDGHILITALLLNATSDTAATPTLGVLAAPRRGPLAGQCPAEPVTFHGSEPAPFVAGDGTPQQYITPVSATGPMTDGYVIAADNPQFGQATGNRLFEWQVSPSGVVSALPDIAVDLFGQPIDAPQPGSPNLIGTWDASFGQAVAHTAADGTVSIFAADATSPDAETPPSVRWYELRPGNTNAIQTGTISGHGQSLFDPSIAPDASGQNLTIVYNASGSTLPEALVASHRWNMAPGATGPPTVIATSTAPDQDFSCDPADGVSCFWGPHVSASTDPLFPAVWVTGQVEGQPDPDTYGGNIGWRTVNAEVIPSA